MDAMKPAEHARARLLSVVRFAASAPTKHVAADADREVLVVAVTGFAVDGDPPLLYRMGPDARRPRRPRGSQLTMSPETVVDRSSGHPGSQDRRPQRAVTCSGHPHPPVRARRVHQVDGRANAWALSHRAGRGPSAR
jgi:hypothetical protein